MLILLTGAVGVGKSTVRRGLVLNHGAVALTAYTTRSVDESDHGTVQLSEEQLTQRVIRRDLVAPYHLAGATYAWSAEELRAARNRESFYVCDVRPYTSLLLSAAIDLALPVLLTAPETELERRRGERGAARDIVSETSDARLEADRIELDTYGRFFVHRVRSDENAVEVVARLVIAHRDNAQ